MERKAGPVTEEGTKAPRFPGPRPVVHGGRTVCTVSQNCTVREKGATSHQDRQEEPPGVEAMLARGGLGAGRLTPTKTSHGIPKIHLSGHRLPGTDSDSPMVRMVCLSAQGWWKRPDLQ